MHVVFLQAFGIAQAGGGARILRALLKDAPVRWTSICSSPEAPPRVPFGEEIHLPIRPSFGRLERTRFAWIAQRFGPLFADRFERKIEAACRRVGATAIHSIPHGLDFIHAHRVARRLGLQFVLNIHDDLRDTAVRVSKDRDCLTRLAGIWNDAEQRFVISEQLGDEYCKRYGQQHYEVITDGIESLSMPRRRPDGVLRIYFMGLFHLRYEPNLRALLDAVEILRKENPGLKVSAVFRCDALRPSVVRDFQGIEVRSFGSEADVEADMLNADLLYMPLPFGEEDACFVRYSLSTKMITYLGSGLPVLYHGPGVSAAGAILAENDAAFCCTGLEPEALASILQSVIANPANVDEKVRNSISLAKRRFMLADQRRRFWAGIPGRRDEKAA